MKKCFKYSALPTALLIIGLFGVQCSKKGTETVLASINSDVITQTDYEDNYFNSILYGNTKDSPQKRREHLDFLIDAYVLAQHGIETGEIGSSDLKNVINRTIRRKTKEELLKIEVEQKVPLPTDADLKKIYAYSSQKLHVRHLFAKRRSDIDSLYQLLQSGADFAQLAYDIFEDSTLKANGGDLGWCNFGDLDPFLEDTLYKMQHGHYSHPVESRFGWHILKLENRSYNPLLTQSDYVQSLEKLNYQFKKREQDKLYYSFINNFMRDKTATIHNPQWGIVMREIRKQYPADLQVSPMLLQLPYSPEIKSGSTTIEDIMDKPIISFPDHDMTVAEFLDWATDQPARTLYGSLKLVTEQIIKDYFLVQEGIRRGLEKNERVKNATDFETSVFAGLKYRNKLLFENFINPDSLSIESVTAAYDSLKDMKFIKDRTITYSQIVLSDSIKAVGCLNELQRVSIDRLIKDYGIPKVGVLESGRFTKKYQEIPGMIRAEILKANDGDYSNILKLNNRFIIVQRHQVITSYKPVGDVESEIRNSLARDMARSIAADSLKIWRDESRIEINYNLLDSLYTD